MLYAGLFKAYHYDEVLKEDRIESFIYFVDAKDPDSAIKLFKNGIRKMAKRTEISICGEIYFNSFIELQKVPPEGALAFYESREDIPFHGTVGCALPGDQTGLNAFQWHEDGTDPEAEDYEETPFLEIPISR